MKIIGIKIHLFKLVGFWQLLFENDSAKRVPWIVLNSIILVYVIGYSQIVQFIRTPLFEKNLVKFIYTMVCALTSMEASVKFLYHWMNRNNMKKLLEAYEVNYLQCAAHNSRRSYEILKKGEKIANAGIVIFYFLIISTDVVWCVTPLAHCFFMDCTVLRILPAWFPFDQTRNTMKAIAYLLDLVSISYLAFTLSVVNAFMLALFVMVSSQVEVLGDALQNIKVNAEMIAYGHSSGISTVRYRNGQRKDVKEIPDGTLQDTMDTLLDACLKDHQKILRTVQLLESVYSPLLLFQSATSCITICSVGVILILPFAAPSTDQSILDSIFKAGLKHLSYLIDAIFELFVFSWIGYLIEEQTERLRLHLYSSDWPDGSRKFRKNILLAITRANRPSSITAGKFQIVNLRFFAVIMKVSYSYLMVLYGFVKKLDIAETNLLLTSNKSTS